jgi:Flp pilus assembly protein TadG
MITRMHKQPRRGATIIESAMVLPVALLFLFGIVVGGMGVFRYNELAFLTREAARYASVHGKQYEEETGKTAATADDIYNDVILPKAAILRPENLTCTITWDEDNHPNRIEGTSQNVITNTVTVTLTYQWDPEIPFFNSLTMSSTSSMHMIH